MRFVIIVSLLGFVSCEQSRGAPLPTEVDPSVATNLEDTPAVVRGSSFFDFVSVSLDDRDSPMINPAWDVRIGDTRVDGTREDEETIAFVVPAGLAVGVYDVTVVAPDGQTGTVGDGLRIIDVPVDIELSIETAADGSGVPIGEVSLAIGEGLDMFAVHRVDGDLVGAPAVTWDVGALGTIDPGPSATARFDAVSVGSGLIQATDDDGRVARAGPIEVRGDEPTRVRIDDAPGGAGTEVGAQLLTVGSALELYAVEVDTGGAFIADATVTWSVSGSIGSVVAGPASSTTLTVDSTGVGRVVAMSDLGVDETGDLTVELPDTVTLIADDPLGDGSRRASVFGHDGSIVVGPSDDGTGARFLSPDGTTTEGRGFSFPRDDSAGSRSRNSSPDPYPSIGVTGCVDDTPTCGPDDENGRGLFVGETIRGLEWMIIGGARDGDLDYVYLSLGGTPVEFRFVDLSNSLGGSTRVVTAIHSFDDTLYLGFADDGGSRPYLMRLEALPDAPGLNANDSQAINLDGQDLPGIRRMGGSHAMIDTISDFADRVYLANASSWVRSLRRRPGSADDGGNWTEITPSDPLYAASASVYVEAERDLESADRAVPYMATFKGRLYVGRNTVDGPQLWVCDPTLSGSATHCDSGDFSIVAPNAAEPGITSFDNPNNTAITLLAATSSHLYVGFDNAVDGVTVFRTFNSSAAVQSDFEGRLGCSADEHPAACEGLGGNGFGEPTNDVIFDAQYVMHPEGEAIYATVGDGVVPARVYALSP